ncbi:hypothetical protein HED54_11645 [Ochrobactrum anthropi ATCC 49188]|nr:hypothetical protein [Brucella anthropi ATCC 49188]
MKNPDHRRNRPSGFLFTAIFTGPAATFAYTQIGQHSQMSGIGLVLYVSLQRVA